MKLKANPDNYIAQPTLSLSTVPILSKSGLSPRHVDLRPFVLMSPKQMIVTKGGLTRVASKKFFSSKFSQVEVLKIHGLLIIKCLDDTLIVFIGYRDILKE